MSTVKEIEAVIPQLSTAEIEKLRTWLDDYLRERERSNGQKSKRRSILQLHALPGKWIGESVLKSCDIADEMFNQK